MFDSIKMKLFKSKRQKFLELQKDISDDSFFEILKVSRELQPYVKEMRALVAECCKIPRIKIHPDTDTFLLSEISPFFSPTIDDIEIMLKIEEKFSIVIDEETQNRFPQFMKKWRFFIWGNSKNISFGKYAVDMARHIRKLVEKSNKIAPLDDNCQEGDDK